MTDRHVYKTGDPCPFEGCDGYIVVYKTKRADNVTKRYHHCKKCKRLPLFNKTIVPSEYVPRRRRHGE